MLPNPGNRRVRGKVPDRRVGIAAVATVITAWTAIFTIAIGCVIVALMKGPAYVADRYDLIDADEPRQDTSDKAGNELER